MTQGNNKIHKIELSDGKFIYTRKLRHSETLRLSTEVFGYCAPMLGLLLDVAKRSDVEAIYESLDSMWIDLYISTRTRSKVKDKLINTLVNEHGVVLTEEDLGMLSEENLLKIEYELLKIHVGRPINNFVMKNDSAKCNYDLLKSKLIKHP